MMMGPVSDLSCFTNEAPRLVVASFRPYLL